MIKPTVLIGTSTHAGAFNEEVVQEMAKGVDRPIIFPVRWSGSNVQCSLISAEQPDRALRSAVCDDSEPNIAELKSRPKDANKWSNGKALMATGSPFEPVDIPGKDKKYVIAECNNVSLAVCRTTLPSGLDIPRSRSRSHTRRSENDDGWDDRSWGQAP